MLEKYNNSCQGQGQMCLLILDLQIHCHVKLHRNLTRDQVTGNFLSQSMVTVKHLWNLMTCTAHTITHTPTKLHTLLVSNF